MRATIDREDCIGCGACVETCPEVFRMADDDLAEVYVDPIPTSAEEMALEAQDECPVSVITVE